MIIFKKKFFFIIENTKDIDLKKLKNSSKFNIIYRFNKLKQNINELLNFREKCRSKKIEFYVSNSLILAKNLKADGLYISAHNKNFRLSFFKQFNFKIIGSAHNIKEINIKKKQGCSNIFFSRLFETNYNEKKGFLGVVKFNLFKSKISENLVPLGGINRKTFNKLKIVDCDSFALSSEIKKNNNLNKFLY